MNYFILLCGGVGKRMKIETPKQYLKYKNKYIFQYSLEQAINTKLFKKYIIVAENSYFSLIKEATKNYNNIQLVEAGKTRQESTYNGLKSIFTNLQSEDIKRIKIGIGKPKYNTIDHVLTKFDKDEKVLIDEAIDKASDAIIYYLQNNFDLCMSKYNHKEKKVEDGSK